VTAMCNKSGYLIMRVCRYFTIWVYLLYT